MTTTATLAADTIRAAAALPLMYGEKLASDITDAQFHLMPHPTMNHPAFCYGHLAVYPNRVLEMLGADAAVPADAAFDDLFKAGVTCVPQDGRYPSKEVIMDRFLAGHRAVLEALRAVDDEVLARQNPGEGRLRDMCPTIGAAVNFLMCAHTMVHLGQVSAWRRAVGLPPAM